MLHLRAGQGSYLARQHTGYFLRNYLMSVQAEAVIPVHEDLATVLLEHFLRVDERHIEPTGEIHNHPVYVVPQIRAVKFIFFERVLVEFARPHEDNAAAAYLLRMKDSDLHQTFILRKAQGRSGCKRGVEQRLCRGDRRIQTPDL